MIVENYKKLDALLNTKDEDQIENIFRDILEEAISILNKKIENNEFLDLNDEIEKHVIRAMFEYMLELYAEGAVEEAKSIGYDMLYLVKDEKLKEMFSMFVIGMLANIDINKFFEKYVNTEHVYKDFFFVDFDNKIDDLVIKYKKQFQEEFSK